MNNIVLCFAFVMLVMLISLPAFAQQQSTDLSQFPRNQTIQTLEAYISDRADSVNFVYPNRDAFLDYSLAIPKGWQARGEDRLKNLQTARRLYGFLAWYDAPGEGDQDRSYLTVRSVALDHEITAKSWLIGHMFDNAFSLRALRERSLTDVEAVYTTHDKLVTYTTWARAFVHGPRVILFEFHVPNSRWTQDRDLQYWTMNSVQMSAEDTQRIEKLRAFAFLDVATFQYPESWELFRNIVRSPDFFRVALFNAQINATPSTQITVQATRLGGATEPEFMADQESLFLEKQNVILNDPLPAPNFIPPDAEVRGVITRVFKLQNRPRSYAEEQNPVIDKEYWVTSFTKNGVAYYVTMFVPARDKIYKDWSRATRAYQIMISTIAGNLLGRKEAETDAGTAIPFLN